MSVKTINPIQLRTLLSKEIEEYRTSFLKKKITYEEMHSLFDQILYEREIMISEFDALKEAVKSGIQKDHFNEQSLNLLIREVDELLYNDFYYLSKKLNYSPGEVLTFLMEDFISRFDGVFPDFSAESLSKLLNIKSKISINRQDQLAITNEDLLDLSDSNTQIDFNYIDTLEFINVDVNSFSRFVGSISHCNLVRVPQTIPKLLLYAKCRNCSYFEFFEEANYPQLNAKKLEYAKEANEVVENWKNGK